MAVHFFSARVAKMVLAGYLDNTHGLSKRELTLPTLRAHEREIVQLVAKGRTSKEVACHLNLSVRFGLRNFSKLPLNRRTCRERRLPRI